MSTEKIILQLPEIYGNFLPEFFHKNIPVESFASCFDCAMVSGNQQEKNVNLKPFRPDIKCCSYYPGLPNYLVGALLEDNDPALKQGKQRIRKIIGKKIGVSPVGIQPPLKYSFLTLGTIDGFGQSKLLLCPYYHRSAGTCTIWKYREATCSSFFCKTVASEAGTAFWRALKEYLYQVEKALCIYVLLTFAFDDIKEILGNFHFGPQQVNKVSVADLEELPPSPGAYGKTWQKWHRKEEEFYKESYHLVKQISPQKLNEIMGVNQELQLRNLEKKWHNMTSIPPILVKNPGLDFKRNENNNYLIEYSSIDTTFEFPVPALDAFDGSITNREVVELLADRYNIELVEEFILSLYHYRILVEKKEAEKLERGEPEKLRS